MCRCTYNVIDTYKSIKNNEEVNENELSSKLALKLTQCNFLFKKKEYIRFSLRTASVFINLYHSYLKGN